jgi:hypothetical protein
MLGVLECGGKAAKRSGATAFGRGRRWGDGVWDRSTLAFLQDARDRRLVVLISDAPPEREWLLGY